jgi:hypothetical protein
MPTIIETNGISDEENFRATIRNAEMQCREKETEVEDAKERLKAAKSDYDDAVAHLRQIASEWSRPLPLFDHASAAATPPKLASPTVLSTMGSSDQWRKRSFPGFLEQSDIAGLGRKKIDAINDAVPTFGHFADLREQADRVNCHLAELMPQGFGTKITDQIEEAFLNESFATDELDSDDMNDDHDLDENEDGDAYEYEDDSDYEEA